ncbi:MAG: hypothetical protein JWM32_1688 [Verrucomicrobia bacterium]|nr:hypothetical protein [Verrucomicrobiota bacterium]
MKSKVVTLGLVAAAMALAGLESHRIIVHPGDGDHETDVGVALGAWRGVLADVVWLCAAERWEERDAEGTERLLGWVTAIDPKPVYFWINGARILAYDVPTWRIAALESEGFMPKSAKERCVRDHAQRAIDRLTAAQRFHPDCPELWIERANIELNVLGDTRAAAASFRSASEQTGAPFFAARIYAELLRGLGEKEQALAWLKKLHPSLPPNNEAAGADRVLARIRALEQELGK